MAAYKKIKSGVRRDPRTYLRALTVALVALCRTLQEALAAIPVAVFILVMLAALLEPDALTSAISGLQSASADEVTLGVFKFVEVVRLVIVPLIGLVALLRAFQQVMRAYDEDIRHQVRIALSVSAIGHVEICECDLDAEVPQSA